MENSLAYYEPQRAIVTNNGDNYTLDVGHNRPILNLTRDTDFGVIEGTKKPSLYKPGAEKICLTYGLMQRYFTESAIEDYNAEIPFFMYRIRCDLVANVNGQEQVICSSNGSANTREKRNGRALPWDTANSSLKMAQKRALVGAAISVSGISDMFAQDIENEDFMSGSKTMVESADPESFITKKQVTRLYAVGTAAGKNAKEVKDLLAAKGYGSTKEIQQKDYDAVIALIQEG
jgi:hypothetical protein